MNFFQSLSSVSAIVAASVWTPAFAQPMPMDHSQMSGMQAPSMTEGEIRKIDKSTGKLTIKHGEIKHMDMPPMTMVFQVSDKAMLDQVQVGDKVRFVVVHEAGKMTVTQIEPMR